MERKHIKRALRDEPLHCIFCNERVEDKTDTIFFCFYCVQFIPQNIVWRMVKESSLDQIRGKAPPSEEWETMAEMAEYCFKKSKEIGFKWRRIDYAIGVKR